MEENKKGCDLREICRVYQSRDIYKQNTFLSDRFPEACENSNEDDYRPGYCPMHDIITTERSVLERVEKSHNRFREEIAKKAETAIQKIVERRRLLNLEFAKFRRVYGE